MNFPWSFPRFYDTIEINLWTRFDYWKEEKYRWQATTILHSFFNGNWDYRLFRDLNKLEVSQKNLSIAKLDIIVIKFKDWRSVNFLVSAVDEGANLLYWYVILTEKDRNNYITAINIKLSFPITKNGYRKFNRCIDWSRAIKALLDGIGESDIAEILVHRKNTANMVSKPVLEEVEKRKWFFQRLLGN